MPSCLCERGAAHHTGRFLSSWVVFIAGLPAGFRRHKRSALPKATLYNKEGSNAAHGFDEGLATAMEQIRAGQSWTLATAGEGAEPVDVGGEITSERARGQWGDSGVHDSPNSLKIYCNSLHKTYPCPRDFKNLIMRSCSHDCYLHIFVSLSFMEKLHSNDLSFNRSRIVKATVFKF